MNYDFLNSSDHAPRVLLLGPFLTPAEIRCVFDGNKTFETVRNCFKPFGNHSKHVETIHTILNSGRLPIRQLRPRQLVLVEPRRSLDEAGQYMDSGAVLDS